MTIAAFLLVLALLLWMMGYIPVDIDPTQFSQDGPLVKIVVTVIVIGICGLIVFKIWKPEQKEITAAPNPPPPPAQNATASGTASRAITLATGSTYIEGMPPDKVAQLQQACP